METLLQFKEQKYELHRYPVTSDKSLKAWSSIELLALDYIQDKNFESYHVFNDRFGVWNCVLHGKQVTTIWTYASQVKAIKNNLAVNNLAVNSASFLEPLTAYGTIDCALIKVPKSLELFELFLTNIYESVHENSVIICGFMTKHFSTSILKIASNYFEDVTQTKAWKKSRLLILKSPQKRVFKKELLKTIFWKDEVLKQYYGVFSSKGIDIGTQFLLENLEVLQNETHVLDVASGNGIIAREILRLNGKSKLTVLDDFNLAIASSKLNLPQDQTTFICDNNLNSLPKQYFDLIVSNPPFHFEYENNIEVSIHLFIQIKACLKPQGRFVLVANKHLNYKVHLKKLFKTVIVINSNKKFEILSCS